MWRYLFVGKFAISNSATSARRDGRRVRHTREIYERIGSKSRSFPLYILFNERNYVVKSEVRAMQRSNSELWPVTDRPLVSPILKETATPWEQVDY